MRLTYDELLDRKDDARQRREAKAERRLDRQLEAAGRLIGELCRAGRTIYYVTVGDYRRGKIRESESRIELVRFLIRNRYV